MARERRGLAAIVSADVVGYSRLMGRDESSTLARPREHRMLRLHPAMRLSNLKEYIPTRRPEDLEVAARYLRLAGLPE